MLVQQLELQLVWPPVAVRRAVTTGFVKWAFARFAHKIVPFALVLCLKITLSQNLILVLVLVPDLFSSFNFFNRFNLFNLVDCFVLLDPTCRPCGFWRQRPQRPRK